MTTTERARIYTDYLASEGYRPESDSDGDIRFKSEGFKYLIIIEEDDEKFFHLLFPGFWNLDSDEAVAEAAEAVNHVNRTTKFAKLSIRSSNNNVDASIEALLDDPADVRKVFPRFLRALQLSVKQFIDRIQEV